LRGKALACKSSLDLLAAASAAELFAKSKTVADIKHVFRSWFGTANYFNK
jgi:hypothetical protein